MGKKKPYNILQNEGRKPMNLIKTFDIIYLIQRALLDLYMNRILVQGKIIPRPKLARVKMRRNDH